jgi:hypothetical protein
VVWHEHCKNRKTPTTIQDQLQAKTEAAMTARIFTATLVLAGAWSVEVSAQVPREYYYPYRPASSTALGDAFRGGSEVIRSAGEAIRNGSVAVVNIEQAKSQYLRNNYDAAKVYWEKRLLWRERTAELRGQPLTSEQIRKIARDAAPDRLTTVQLSPASGQINWPEPLRRPEFDKLRPELEKIFANRTIANSGVGSSSEASVARLTKAMRQDLKTQIHEMTTTEYIVARDFLRSLAYEARFVPGLEGVAQR